jgi:inorganic pyrophosphatase
MTTPLTDDLKKEYLSLIGKRVSVTMDRPIGTEHPKHPNVFYPINYGYIEGLLGGDGEEQDVYVLDCDFPLEKCDATLIAVVHRFDDDECKWVASYTGAKHSAEEIESAIRFQEQFHDSVIVV